MNDKRPLSVLVAPLDWGLGHATRCIPVINELIQQGMLVTVAASGNQRALIIQEFPQLEFIEIPGYDIRYGKGFLLKWTLLFRIRTILKKIKKENKWLENVLGNRNFDVVISDNRYGLFNKKSYCVFITHQLSIQSGWQSKESAGRWPLAVGRWIDDKILDWNYRFIGKFSCCWVPDWKSEDSLAGKLSHPDVLPKIPVKYIGILSRLQKSNKKIVKDSVLILLSGPEPQRTELENLFFKQMPDYPMQFMVVRGLPGLNSPVPFAGKGIKIYNHLPAVELNELIDMSDIIIARSGYSTIMDLVILGKSAILMPTPGQTEQEYLAAYLGEKKWMYCSPQKNFNLSNALSAFQSMEKQIPAIPESELQDVIKELVKTVSGKI
ncbi:MAG TPA: glycosyltransferase [Puia sp.]|nr:glycosyltransferase [Puia sp.]